MMPGFKALVNFSTVSRDMLELSVDFILTLNYVWLGRSPGD
jgi:hypothetical protein